VFRLNFAKDVILRFKQIYNNSNGTNKPVFKKNQCKLSDESPKSEILVQTLLLANVAQIGISLS
jgi:hypothetical protein